METALNIVRTVVKILFVVWSIWSIDQLPVSDEWKAFIYGVLLGFVVTVVGTLIIGRAMRGIDASSNGN